MPTQPERRAICGAKLKNGTGHCKRLPSTGRSRCHVHGGATPRGIASPHFQHGRYSKALPERLAATYEQARHDPELLNLRDEIGLIDARMIELLQPPDREATVPPPVDWGQVCSLIEHRRRLCESEQKRMIVMRQLLTGEQVILLVSALISAVKLHVKDAETLGRISEDIGRLINRPTLAEGGIVIPNNLAIDI